MATLSDTPTPTMLATSKSEAGGVVSIKIEQGVLRENDDDEYEGSGYMNVERRGISSVQHDSNHPPAMENGSNAFCDNKFNMFNISHSIFQPDVEIKSEPPIDIDDSNREESEENTNSPNTSQCSTPKIRLTPTSKLIAVPNGSGDKKRRFMCPYENCTKSYGKSSHLRSHLTWHTGVKPFVCQEPGCGKGFTRSDELNRHIRTHTGEKPFECVQCTKKFSRSDHLTKHLATHTKQLATNKRATAKKIKLDPNKAPERSKEISNDDFKNEELEESEPKPEIKLPELTISVVESKETENFKIKLEKPENNDDFKIALPKQETDIQQKSLQLKSLQEPEIEIKPEPLEELDTSRNSEIMYENEPDDNAIMPEANLPPLTQFAPRALASPVKATISPHDILINRLADSVYDLTRPYSCTHCPKNFKRQDDLNRHMRTHTGEKPFACNECDKRFMRSDHLKKHMNTHTRVR